MFLVKGDLVDDICSQSDKDYHCSFILRSNPNIKQDNIIDLSNTILSKIQDTCGIARFELYPLLQKESKL